MTKKTLEIVTGVIGGVAAAVSAVVTLIAPPATPAIVGAIGIGSTAIIEICTLFVKK